MKHGLKNPLDAYLSLLGVKHTTTYTCELFDGHPYKNSLFGLYKMLEEYNVQSEALRMENKDDLNQLQPPFMAQVSDDLVVVKSISNDRVGYLWRGREVFAAVDVFKKAWTGVVLLSKKSDESIEKGYKLHRKSELMRNIYVYVLAFSVLLAICVGVLQNLIYECFPCIGSLAISFFGIYIAYLLLLKQLHVFNGQANKICSLFSHNDCNDVLDSPGSKILGNVSWSEIGLGYFISNVLIIVFSPHLLCYVFIGNILALPYSFWSIWYQKYRVGHWCMLCLIVQALLWMHFVLLLTQSESYSPSWNCIDLAAVFFMYTIPFLCIHLTVPYWKAKYESIYFRQLADNFRMKDDVFMALLKKEKNIECNSCILLGNPDAKNKITVLTNPHCEPCGNMHKLLDQLLSDTDNGFCIQYVFSSFGEQFDNSCKFLIAAYLQLGLKEAHEVYKKWYEWGKYKREQFMFDYELDLNDKSVLDEWNKHIAWQMKSSFTATPTVLFCDRVLPKEYKIFDLKYFVDIDIISCVEKATAQN